MSDIVVWRGFKFDPRTVKMIQWAEAQAGFRFRISQGAYSTGVAASAGTHDGGGVVDFSTRLMTPKRRERMLRTLKDAGFAAWYRTKADGFDSPHVHAVAIGCKDLAALAKSQVTDYDKGRSGLKGHAVDPTYRPEPPVKFDEKAGQPVPRKVAS